MKTPECIEFVASDEFKIHFNAILEHDKKIFEEPKAGKSNQCSNPH
jgi:hypothetical protein